MMKSLFEYQELRSPREIRLIKLCQPDPGLPPAPSEPSPIDFKRKFRSKTKAKDSNEQKPQKKWEFELITTTIHDAPLYETVSHIWGSGRRDVQLDLKGGRQLAVTRLLLESMEDLATVAETEYLWIDQICIDQGNVAEKSQQVNIMGEIYKQSHRVMIYLASNLYPVGLQKPVWREQERFYSYDGGKISFKHIVTGLSNIQKDLLRSLPAESIISYTAFKEHATKNSSILLSEINLWTTFYLFFRHPYFTRGWVFQEMALAPRSRFVSCGIELDTYFVAWASEQATSQEVEALGSLFARFALLDSSVGYMRLQSTVSFKKTNPLDILDTVSSGSKFGVPQDYVYGILGLTTYQLLEPDYNLPWSKVFIRAAASIIDNDGTLRILGHLSRLPNRANDLDVKPRSDALPSWVPCWSDPRTPEKLLASGKDYRAYELCKKRRHVLPATKNLPYLHVRGGRIDTVCQVMNGDQIMHINSLFSLLQKAVKLASSTEKLNPLSPKDKNSGSGSGSTQGAPRLKRKQKLRSLLHSMKPHHNRDSKIAKHPTNPFERLVLLGLRTQDGHSSQTKDLRKEAGSKIASTFPTLRQLDYSGDLRNLHSNSDLSDSVRHELEALQKLLDKKSLFVLYDGRLGCAREKTTIDVGNLACVLHGLEVPIVLSKQGRNGRNLGDEFSVVDLCQLENTMLGEAVFWKEDEAEEFVLC